LCKSLSGLSIPLITITDFQDDADTLSNKKVIFLQSRVHPGETHSSWIIHGLIKALLQKDALARAMRAKFIFKIIPMINPDGVVFGNYRCTFLGKDMNRMFMNDLEESTNTDWEKSEGLDERLIPEIVAVRRLLHCI
jgi:murein tripeptide amidase MpaA